jgi:hypothetical protein
VIQRLADVDQVDVLNRLVLVADLPLEVVDVVEVAVDRLRVLAEPVAWFDTDRPVAVDRHLVATATKCLGQKHLHPPGIDAPNNAITHS